jgi:phospholipid transport system substrate-binding protein
MLHEPLDRRQLLNGLQLAIAALLLGGRSAQAQVSADAARQMIQNVGVEVLAVLRDPALANQQKFDRLVALLDGPIDLEIIARLILGRHWRSASEAQQAEYLELFRAFALDNLASRLHVYDGHDFEIVGAQAVNERDAVVATRVTGGGRPPLKVDWRVRERGDGGLVAIDVIIEGISLIVTQRSEFSAVIERRGMDGLLAELRQRV